MLSTTFIVESLTTDNVENNTGSQREGAPLWANHASTWTTQLYDRRSDDVTLDEAEGIIF